MCCSSAIRLAPASLPWSSIASSVLKRTPAREHGTVVGVLSAFYDLFVGTSSFAAGAVSARFGYSYAFLMASASLVMAGVMGTFVFRREDRVVATEEDVALEPVEL